MKIMSVDLGKARTGIAVSDIAESFAFPSCVITEYNEERLIQKVAEKAKELSAELIVAGLPKNMDGSEGFRADECRQTAERIAEASGIKVVMWDERCTTVSAHTRAFLADAEKGGRVVNVTHELPRSFVVCAHPVEGETVYICQLSPATLLRRIQKARRGDFG